MEVLARRHLGGPFIADERGEAVLARCTSLRQQWSFPRRTGTWRPSGQYIIASGKVPREKESMISSATAMPSPLLNLVVPLPALGVLEKGFVSGVQVRKESPCCPSGRRSPENPTVGRGGPGPRWWTELPLHARSDRPLPGRGGYRTHRHPWRKRCAGGYPPRKPGWRMSRWRKGSTAAQGSRPSGALSASVPASEAAAPSAGALMPNSSKPAISSVDASLMNPSLGFKMNSGSSLLITSPEQRGLSQSGFTANRPLPVSASASAVKV